MPTRWQRHKAGDVADSSRVSDSPARRRNADNSRVGDNPARQRGNADSSHVGDKPAPQRGNADSSRVGDSPARQRGNADSSRVGDKPAGQRGNAGSSRVGNSPARRGNADSGRVSEMPVRQRGDASDADNGRASGNLHGQRFTSAGIALIADVQFGVWRRSGKLEDVPEDCRMYSLTLDTLRRSTRHARELGAKALVLLGDQVDDRDPNGDAAAVQVLATAEAEFPDRTLGYLLGNHDTKWTRTFRDARERAPVAELGGYFAWECEVASEDDGPAWVLLALDCYALADVPWGLQAPPNGEVGELQLAWLRRRLLAAREEGKSAVVLSHVPLHPGNSLRRQGPRHRTAKPGGGTHTVRDSDAVRAVLKEVGNVRLCIAGHDHMGAYFCDEAGIQYFTLRACLAVRGPSELTGAVLRLRSDRAVLTMLCDGTEHHVLYPAAVGHPKEEGKEEAATRRPKEEAKEEAGGALEGH